MSKEREFKVIALNVTGRSNNLAYAGQTVKESFFPLGQADVKEKQGFIEEIKPDKTPSQMNKSDLIDYALSIGINGDEIDGLSKDKILTKVQEVEEK